jgi:hypothetical protein
VVRQQKLPELENKRQITEKVIHFTKPSNYKGITYYDATKKLVLVTICIDMGAQLDRKIICK